MGTSELQLALLEGESLKVEFKERLLHLDREIVAFANTSGGTVYIGVSDDNRIVGIELSNKLKSQIIDIVRNCDPSIHITFKEYRAEKVLALIVKEGNDKPYRCRDGFFMRLGPSSQKLKRDEIVNLVNENSTCSFDEILNTDFSYPKDFSLEKFESYLKLCGINIKASTDDVLISLNVATKENDKLIFTNAGILFFAKDPQKFFREAFVTCVKYQSNDRFSILDKKDFNGSLIEQVDAAMQFVLRHMSVSYVISGEQVQRKEVYEFSPRALREAIINAVVHRDYRFDSSHIYLHMFLDHIDVENPGGLMGGMTTADLGRRSVRRNRLIADLLHRVGYIERVGSGFDRMRQALAENNNPPLEISATNFFSLRFYKRIENAEVAQLTQRQQTIYRILQQHHVLSKKEIMSFLSLSGDSILRELKILMSLGLVKKQGVGRAITYQLKDTRP